MTFDTRILEFGAVREMLAARCVCELGRRRVAELAPVADRPSLESAIALVGEQMALLADRLEPPIHGMRDITAQIAKVSRERAVLEPDELLHLKDFLETAGHMRNFFAAHAAIAPGLHALALPLFNCPPLIRSIDEKISPNGTVRDTASDDLRAIRSEILAIENQIQKDLQRMVRSLADAGDLQDDFFTLRNNRYVLPVKTSNRGRVRGIIHDSSNTGETVFIEPFEILEQSNRLAELKVREREEVYRILLRIAGHVRDEINVLVSNSGILSEFDLVYAKARFGVQHACAFPSLTDMDRPVSLVDAHHPLLFARDPEASRPLTLSLGEDDHIMVITGPNAGGKTTALKTVGLTVLMVQSAVPAPLSPRSHLPVFTHVLADIGDEQNILEGVSTFSAHMRRMVEMLKMADAGTLVLLDELGTATDPGEGAALAVAVLEWLAQRASLSMASSHLGALKIWAHNHPRARNASFRLAEKTHRPTFQLALDLPGISEALVIAEQAGLPAEIVERARSLQPAGEGDATRLLVDLQKRQQELGEEIARVRASQQDLEDAKRRLAQAEAQLREDKRSFRSRLLAEQEKLLRENRQKIETMIAHLPSKRELLDARTETDAQIAGIAREQVEIRGEQAMDEGGPVAEGGRVRVASLNDEGVVEKVDPKRGEARVALRRMTVTVKLADLVPLEPESAEEAPLSRVHFRRPGDMPTSIDLHGLRAEDAVKKVDKFLDDALAAGLPSVRLVHGHGTGALRRAIHDHLREHTQVRNFRHGAPNEGGGSVTVVEFK
jgi:DNA mismatch repair protein MutS2